MEIIKAKVSDMPAVREIFLEFQKVLNTPYCFQNFEKELAGLPGQYAAPTGAIYLALVNSKVIGCAGIIPVINKDGVASKITAEFKHLYVRSDYHGHGIGKELLQLVIGEAKILGYESVVLETMDKMKQAKNLYLRYGFEPIPTYYENTEKDVECFRYLFS